MFCYCVILVIGVILAWLGELLYSANVFRSFKRFGDSKCSRVHADGAVGVEDGDVAGEQLIWSAGVYF